MRRQFILAAKILAAQEGIDLFGAKTGSVPTVTDIGNFQLGPGRGQAPNYKSGNVREALSKDSRSWRCPRCNTMNRPTSLSCVACVKPRAGGSASKGPSVWTPN